MIGKTKSLAVQRGAAAYFVGPRGTMRKKERGGKKGLLRSHKCTTTSTKHTRIQAAELIRRFSVGASSSFCKMVVFTKSPRVLSGGDKLKEPLKFYLPVFESSIIQAGP